MPNDSSPFGIKKNCFTKEKAGEMPFENKKKGDKTVKKIWCLILSIILLLAEMPCGLVAANEAQTTGRTYFDYDFLFPRTDPDTGKNRISGWDINDAGGEILKAAYLQMTDTNVEAPIEAVRQFDPYSSGGAKLELKFYTSMLDGIVFDVRNGTQSGILMEIENGNLYVIDNNKTKQLLGRIKTQQEYGLRVDIDMEQKSCDYYLDGNLVGENIPFYDRTASKLNHFYIGTGKESTGTLAIVAARLYGGYAIREDFEFTANTIPDDWTLYENDTQVQGAAHLLNCDTKDVLLSKAFELLSGSVDVEFQLKFDNLRGNAAIELDNGTVIGSNGSAFYYTDAQGTLTPFYSGYLANMWYHFKLNLNFDTNKMTIWLNGKKKAENVSILGNGLSEIMFDFKSGVYKISVQGINISNTVENTDYVPEPEKVVSSDYAIGMQMCPLWTEGERYGYDWLSDAPGRKPLLGYYDEGAPEVSDWEIKWMAEHGIDFQWHCWYKNGGVQEPLCDLNLTPDIHSGFFNARYSDLMKFAILWENLAESDWTDNPAQNREKFLQYVVPFWIEYYFKDERYYTVNGRPLLGIYNLTKLREVFGTATEIAQMFGNMETQCTAAGVGAPFIMISSYLVDYTDGAFNLYKSMGIDAVYTYNIPYWPEQQQSYFEQGAGCAQRTGMTYIPSFTSGYDVLLNGGRTGIYVSTSQFEDFLSESKQDFLTALPATGGKKLVMMASWNEYTEGHYMMPSEQDGFGYLDAIRTVLVGNTAHEDVMPTAQQLERITQRYPRDRITNILEDNIPSVIPANAVAQEPWVWNETLTADGNGTAQITKSNYHPNLTESPYIRMRLENDSDAYAFDLYYTTDVDPEWSDRHKISVHIGTGTGTETTVDIPIGKYKQYWKGTLSAVRLEFIGATSGQQIKILDMKFYNLEPTGLQLNIDGAQIPFACNIIEETGQTWIDAESVSRALGGAYYFDPAEKRMWLKQAGGQVVRMNKEGGFSVDHVERVQLLSLKIIDQKLYMTPEALSEIAGRKIIKQGNVIHVTTPVEQMETYYVEPFDIDEGAFTVYYSISRCAVENGAYNVEYPAGDPIILASDLTGKYLYCEDIQEIVIRMKSENAFTGQVFYTTQTHPTFTETQSAAFDVEAGNTYQQYRIKINRDTWTGQLRAFRLDLGDNIANQVWIDEIRFVGKANLPSKIVSSNPTDGASAISTDLEQITLTLSDVPQNVTAQTLTIKNATVGDIQVDDKTIKVPVSGLQAGTTYTICLDGVACGGHQIKEAISFTTAIDENKQNRIDFQGVSQFHWGGNYENMGSAPEGWWRVIPEKGKSTYLYLLPEDRNIDGSPNLYVCVKSQHDITASVYFITKGSPGWSESKCLYYNIKGGDEMQVYKIPASANGNWNGTLSQLRLDFGGCTEDNVIDIAYVMFDDDLYEEGIITGNGYYYKRQGMEKNEIQNLQIGDVLFAWDAIYNATSAQKTIWEVVALFKDGEMVRCGKQQKKVLPFSAVYRPFDVGVYVGETDGYSVEAFLWEDDMNPILSTKRL